VIFSSKHKFLFIHNPKTGGSSIGLELRKFHQPRERTRFFKESLKKKEVGDEAHVRAATMKPLFIKNNWKWDDWYKFGFVRNPWDREVSIYYFFSRNLKLMNPNLQKMWPKTFEEYVHADRIPIVGRAAYEDQMMYFNDVDNNCLLDFVGRFENLQEDFNTICDKIGIPKVKLSHINKAPHKSYVKEYSPEGIEIVRKKNQDFIKRFGYEFGK
jgi:hypothetical protein